MDSCKATYKKVFSDCELEKIDGKETKCEQVRQRAIKRCDERDTRCRLGQVPEYWSCVKTCKNAALSEKETCLTSKIKCDIAQEKCKVDNAGNTEKSK